MKRNLFLNTISQENNYATPVADVLSFEIEESLAISNTEPIDDNPEEHDWV